MIKDNNNRYRNRNGIKRVGMNTPKHRSSPRKMSNNASYPTPSGKRGMKPSLIPIRKQTTPVASKSSPIRHNIVRTSTATKKNRKKSPLSKRKSNKISNLAQGKKIKSKSIESSLHETPPSKHRSSTNNEVWTPPMDSISKLLSRVETIRNEVKDTTVTVDRFMESLHRAIDRQQEMEELAQKLKSNSVRRRKAMMLASTPYKNKQNLNVQFRLSTEDTTAVNKNTHLVSTIEKTSDVNSSSTSSNSIDELIASVKKNRNIRRKLLEEQEVILTSSSCRRSDHGSNVNSEKQSASNKEKLLSPKMKNKSYNDYNSNNNPSRSITHINTDKTGGVNTRFKEIATSTFSNEFKIPIDSNKEYQPDKASVLWNIMRRTFDSEFGIQTSKPSELIVAAILHDYLSNTASTTL